MSSSTRSSSSWTSSTCCRATRCSPSYAGRPSALGRAGCRWAGSTSRAGSSRSATRAADSASTTRSRGTRVWLEPYRLADRLVTNGEWLAFMADGGYRRHELWLSDGWAQVRTHGLAGPALLDRARRGVARAHPQRHGAGQPGAAGQPRQLLRGRGLCHLGRQAAAHGVRAGSTPSSPTGRRSSATSPTRRRSTPGRRGRPPGGCARPTATAGSGRPRPITPTPAFTRRRVRSASTTASSCPTRWSSGAAAR